MRLLRNIIDRVLQAALRPAFARAQQLLVAQLEEAHVDMAVGRLWAVLGRQLAAELPCETVKTCVRAVDVAFAQATSAVGPAIGADLALRAAQDAASQWRCEATDLVSKHRGEAAMAEALSSAQVSNVLDVALVDAQRGKLWSIMVADLATKVAREDLAQSAQFADAHFRECAAEACQNPAVSAIIEEAVAEWRSAVRTLLSRP